MEIKELYQNGALYDAECDAMMKDTDFWRTIIDQFRPKTVLEIGCGTGRIAECIITLIEKYVGIDISEPFLDYLRGKDFYKKSRDKIYLYNMDACSLNLFEKFDLILLTSQFPGHIYQFQNLIQIMKSLRNLLMPDGRVVIDYCNPDLRFLESHQSYTPCYEFSYDGVTKVYEKNNYNQIQQINIQKRRYVFQNGTELYQEIPFRIYFPQEMDLILECCGFQIDHKYGDYDFSKYQEYCVKQLYVLSRG